MARHESYSRYRRDRHGGPPGSLSIGGHRHACPRTGTQPRRGSFATRVPAFWEDQLFGEEERSAVRFRIGGVNFAGSNPCARCQVPPRDPQTGEIIPGFQKTFSDHRRSHIPAWTPEGRFDHYYRLATNTRVAPAESGTLLRINDSLVID